MARLLAAMIPDDIAKSISNDEYNDRLVEAARLSAQANDPALTPALRTAARTRARAVLQAQPRAVTMQEHREMIAKAAKMPAGWRAEMVREHARALLEEKHPIAPRRGAPVTKAISISGGVIPTVVFDADGRLLGLCDPADITAVDGAVPTGELTPQPPAEAGIPAQDVAKSAGRVVVYDQWGRRYAADPRRITRLAARVAKAAPAKGMVRVTDDDGNAFWASPEHLKGPASPDAQARDSGPVTAGGTTGLGKPRATGPAASGPADGPQRALPGDVADRQVVKASSLGLPFRTLGEAARERRLARIAKATGQDFSRPHVYAANLYSPYGRCVCEAPPHHRVHTGLAPGRPFNGAEAKIAKSSAWEPQLTSRATEKWLAAQRRR